METKNLLINIEKIDLFVDGFLQQHFGVKPTSVANDPIWRRGTVFFTRDMPQDHGTFAMIIKRSYLKVSASVVGGTVDGQEAIYISLGLHYEHPDGGTNGYTIATVWCDADYQYITHR